MVLVVSDIDADVPEGAAVLHAAASSCPGLHDVVFAAEDRPLFEETLKGSRHRNGALSRTYHMSPLLLVLLDLQGDGHGLRRLLAFGRLRGCGLDIRDCGLRLNFQGLCTALGLGLAFAAAGREQAERCGEYRRADARVQT